jgi:hypothetical protein
VLLVRFGASSGLHPAVVGQLAVHQLSGISCHGDMPATACLVDCGNALSDKSFVCVLCFVLLRFQVAMLNALGAGFDCASVQELKCAAAHDVPQDRVIFANPCKRPADFR